MAALPAYTLSHDMSQLSELLRIAAMHLHNSFSQLVWLALASRPLSSTTSRAQGRFWSKETKVNQSFTNFKSGIKEGKLIIQKACEFIKHVIVGLPDTNQRETFYQTSASSIFLD